MYVRNINLSVEVESWPRSRDNNSNIWANQLTEKEENNLHGRGSQLIMKKGNNSNGEGSQLTRSRKILSLVEVVSCWRWRKKSRYSLKFFREFTNIFVNEVWLSAYYRLKVELLFSVIPCFSIFSSKYCRVVLDTHGLIFSKITSEVVIGSLKLIFLLSAVYLNFPQDNSRKDWTFCGLPCGKACLSRNIIRGKFWLSENYPAERHAFLQGNRRKVKTFHGFYRGKACLNAE